MPPGWDENYITVFGATYDEVGVEGLTLDDHQAALGGLACRETLPGTGAAASGADADRDLAARARHWRKAGMIGVREGPSKRDPETVALLFDTIRRQVNPEHGLKRPTTFQWEFTDPDVPAWHLRVDNGSSVVEQGQRRDPICACASPTRTSWTSWANDWTR